MKVQLPVLWLKEMDIALVGQKPLSLSMQASSPEWQANLQWSFPTAQHFPHSRAQKDGLWSWKGPVNSLVWSEHWSYNEKSLASLLWSFTQCHKCGQETHAKMSNQCSFSLLNVVNMVLWTNPHSLGQVSAYALSFKLRGRLARIASLWRLWLTKT